MKNLALQSVQQFKKTIKTGMLAATLLLSTSASAALIPLELETGTDIVNQFVTVGYDGTTLFADGFATSFSDGISSINIANGLFNLVAEINSSGVLANNGTLSIAGTIASLGFNSGSLLTGELTALGFESGGPLEFLFSVTGGDMAAIFGGFGATRGVILENSNFSSFANPFSSGPFQARADVGVPVPEPTGLLLLSSGLLGLLVLRRRRS